MKPPSPGARRVENSAGQVVLVVGRGGTVAVEVGTAEGFLQVLFTDPNALNALAAHLMVEAEILRDYQKSVATLPA